MENDEQKTANLIIKKDFSSFNTFKFEYKEQNLNIIYRISKVERINVNRIWK